MPANPSKFQALSAGEKTKNEGSCFKYEINCDASVKLLGITVDFRLSFD